MTSLPWVQWFRFGLADGSLCLLHREIHSFTHDCLFPLGLVVQGLDGPTGEKGSTGPPGSIGLPGATVGPSFVL